MYLASFGIEAVGPPPMWKTEPFAESDEAFLPGQLRGEFLEALPP